MSVVYRVCAEYQVKFLLGKSWPYERLWGTLIVIWLIPLKYIIDMTNSSLSHDRKYQYVLLFLVLNDQLLAPTTLS